MEGIKECVKNLTEFAVIIQKIMTFFSDTTR